MSWSWHALSESWSGHICSLCMYQPPSHTFTDCFLPFGMRFNNIFKNPLKSVSRSLEKKKIFFWFWCDHVSSFHRLNEQLIYDATAEWRALGKSKTKKNAKLWKRFLFNIFISIKEKIKIPFVPFDCNVCIN